MKPSANSNNGSTKASPAFMSSGRGCAQTTANPHSYNQQHTDFRTKRHFLQNDALDINSLRKKSGHLSDSIPPNRLPILNY
jgi:hypothetical protein